MSDETKWVAVGSVGRAHGVRGEVRLRLTPGTALEIEKGLPVRLTRKEPAETCETSLASVRAATTDSPIVSFDGIEGRESAAGWATAVVEVPADVLEELDEGEFYYHEVIGSRVVDSRGAELGEVTDVWEGGKFFLVCQTARGEGYLPISTETLLQIHPEAHEVVVDPEAMIYPDEVEA